MIEWSDRAIVLSTRPHGEDAAVVSLLTADHGRHGGIVRGARGKRTRGALEPGTLVEAQWKARLDEHLGNLTVEPLAAVAGILLSDRDRLAALSSCCALADHVLPDRAPHPEVFGGLLAVLDALAHEDAPLAWAATLCRWELDLLAAIGFGLDLSACAATGVTEELTWVSPKSGRAVSRAAGEPWKGKLLPLPGFLLDGDRAAGGVGEIRAALALTGYFLGRAPIGPRGGDPPLARQRLVDRLARWTTISGE